MTRFILQLALASATLFLATRLSLSQTAWSNWAATGVLIAGAVVIVAMMPIRRVI